MGRIILGVGSALILFAGSVQAQNEFQEQVRNQISNAAGALEAAGYAMSVDPETGSLEDGASEDFWIRLVGGMDYALVGVCDVDCDDIDLEIFDEDGNSIDDDFQLDDVPTLEFTAPANGRYRVTVSMASCNVEPCYYGVGTFLASGS